MFALRKSLSRIALAKAGHVNFNGQPFNPSSVKAMIDGPLPADLAEETERRLPLQQQRTGETLRTG